MHFLSAVFCKTSSLRIYEYDDYGNMTSYVDYDGGTHTFTYDQYNRLKTIGEEEVTYNDSTDKVSLNPSSISGMTLTFTGRNLSTLVSDTAAIRFDYNEQGLRTYKINSKNQTFQEYFYDLDGKLIAENKVASTGAEDRINFLYHDNYLYGFTHNGTYYYYLRDSLGCINGIFDANGNLVVEYRYNAFGKILDITGELKDTIGVYNPIRYKGYYYDAETQLYWVSSRYYSPELCRWISPDSIEYLDTESINGLNLYAYCGNDPVNKYDPTGHFWDYVLDAVFIGIGIYDFVKDPSWSKGLWLVADIVLAVLPFIPAISGIRHLNKVDNIVDLTKSYGHIDNFADAGGVIRNADKLDFVDNGWDLVNGLNKTDEGFTISNRFIGTEIHTKFKYGSRVIDIHNRVDGIDDAARLIYELKPYSKRNIRQGIRQVYRYQKAVYKRYGFVYDMILVVY